MLETITIAVFQAILVSGLLGLFIFKRQETIKGKIAEEFSKRDKHYDIHLNYKLQALEELLAPLLMQLKRSEGVLKKYKGEDPFSEAIFKECNETAHDLLLKKSFLVPPDLLDEAVALLYHYDSWLQLYHQKRVVEKDTTMKFLFTHDFPPNAEKKFIEKYNEYRKALGMDKATKQSPDEIKFKPKINHLKS